MSAILLFIERVAIILLKMLERDIHGKYMLFEISSIYGPPRVALWSSLNNAIHTRVEIKYM